jgi:hypothetical protein
MRVDHLVWYSADLEHSTRIFAEKMDRAPVYGGVHPGEATRNSLLSLSENTYLEILGRDPAQTTQGLDEELQELDGGALYHWAASGEDLESIRERVLAAGYRGSAIVAGGRSLPDGSHLSWRLFGVRDHGFGALVPFFIDWAESTHPATTAPRGGRLMSVTAASPAADRLKALYEMLGLAIEVTPAAKPGFHGVIKSSKGMQVLSMFDPVPRGFVI